MIGTGREMLYCISLRFGWHSELTQVPAKTRYWWNFLIKRGTFGEELCEIILPLFGAKKIREAIIYPAVYINKKKDKIDEATLLECITSKRLWYDGVITRYASRTICNKHWSRIRRQTLDVVFNHYGWTLYQERQYCQSLWELKQELDCRYAPKVDYSKTYERDINSTGDMGVRKRYNKKHDYLHGERTNYDKRRGC